MHFVNFNPTTFQNECKNNRPNNENGKDIRENIGRKKCTNYALQRPINVLGERKFSFQHPGFLDERGMPGGDVRAEGTAGAGSGLGELGAVLPTRDSPLFPCHYGEAEGVPARGMLSSGASRTEVLDVRDGRVQLGGRRLTVSACCHATQTRYQGHFLNNLLVSRTLHLHCRAC